MKRTTRIIMAAGAGGTILAAGVAAAVPAFAGNGPGPGQGPAATATAARDFGVRGGPHGTGTGVRCDPAQWAAGTLTSEQKTTLAHMAEEEKLARDLYADFAARYDIPAFGRIAVAETQHLDAIRAALKAYGVADPTAGKPAGAFASATVQAQYNRLLMQGRVSQDAALRAVRTVEQADIADLGKALSGLTAPRLQHIYTNLMNAERKHLATVEYWIAR